MSGLKLLVNRWKTDFDFKTAVSSIGSFAATVVFAIYNGYLGIRHSSMWHGMICAYYLVLVLLRGVLFAAEKKSAGSEQRDKLRKKAYRTGSVLLLLLNLTLIAPAALMVTQQKPVSLTLVPAIAMAAYTTLRVIMASVNLKRRKRSDNSLIRLLRAIGFIDALVSVLTLQNTLIMVTTEENGMRLLPLTAISSGAIWLFVLLLSVAAIRRGFMKESAEN